MIAFSPKRALEEPASPFLQLTPQNFLVVLEPDVGAVRLAFLKVIQYLRSEIETSSPAHTEVERAVVAIATWEIREFGEVYNRLFPKKGKRKAVRV